MKMKAITFLKPDGSYEVKACENPMLPPFTRAHVKINQEVLYSPEIPTTQMVNVEITFSCLKYSFETDLLESIADHSRTHKETTN
jgi:hypothetical protein